MQDILEYEKVMIDTHAVLDNSGRVVDTYREEQRACLTTRREARAA